MDPREDFKKAALDILATPIRVYSGLFNAIARGVEGEHRTSETSAKFISGGLLGTIAFLMNDPPSALSIISTVALFPGAVRLVYFLLEGRNSPFEKSQTIPENNNSDINLPENKP